MAANIKFYYTKGPDGDGGASNPNKSLGGLNSTDPIPSSGLNSLFDNISAAEAVQNNYTDVRAICIKNDGDIPLYDAKVNGWISANPSGSTSIELANDTADTRFVNVETEVPGISFGTYGENDTPLSLSKGGTTTIGVGETRRLWIKRINGPNSSAINSENLKIQVKGEST